MKQIQKVFFKLLYKRVFTRFVINVCFIIFLFSLLYSSSIFWIGFHNIDLGYNIQVVNKLHDINLIDNGSNNIIRTGYELYSLGIDQIIHAYYLGLLSVFSMGIVLIKKWV